MNPTYKISCIIALIILCSGASAQPWMHSPYLKIKTPADSSKLTNFYEIQKAFELYEKKYEGKNDKKENDGEEDEGKFPGYAQFKRWEWHMAPRVYPSGDITLPSTTQQKFQEYLNSANYRASNSSRVNFSGNWIPLGPTGTHFNSYFGGAGRVNFLRIDPTNSNIMWTGSPTGGLWKTIDGGLNWTTNTDQLPIIGCSDVAINPINTQIMYLATGDGNGAGSQLTLASIGVLKSTDGGATWGNNTMNWQVSWNWNIYELIINPANPNVVLAATSNGIYRTGNAGASWVMTQAGQFTQVEFMPGNPNVVYAVSGVWSGGTFYKSVNGGATFVPAGIGLPPSANVGRLVIGVTPADANYVYIAAVKAVTYDCYGFYRSVDAGNNFTLRSNVPNVLGNGAFSQAWYNAAMAVSPFHKDTIIAGGTDTYRSTDGGLTWTKHTSNSGIGAPFVHPDHHAMAYLPGNDSTYFLGNDGGVWKTSDYGVTWTPMNEGLQIAQMYKLGTAAINPNTIMTGHQDMCTHILKSNAWNIFVNTGDGMENLFEYDNDTIVYIESYNGRLIKSINSIPWFSNVCGNNGVGAGAAGNWITPVVMHPVYDTILLIGKAQVWRTVNSGVSFSQVGNIPAVGLNIVALAYAPSNPDFIYAAKAFHFFVATDGNTFTERTAGLPVPGQQITAIAVSNTQPGKVWVTFSGYTANKVWASSDTGKTWADYSAGLPNLSVNCIVYQNNTNNALYAGTDVGVYLIADSLASWQPFFSGLPNVDVEELEIAYSINKIRAATNGRGLWETDLPIITGTLPVELLSFTGYNSNKNNYLDWSTASETQTLKFEIERSADADAFLKTGEVTAHGNSTSINNYSFTDYNVPLGINYYRLRQVDLNGEYKYSNTIAIQNPSTGLDFEVFPVPFKDEININIFSRDNQPAEIKVTDIFGRTIILITVSSHNINLQTSNWNNGIYFLKIDNVVKKIVKR